MSTNVDIGDREPIPVQVTRYRCPSCSRTMASRSSIRKHINRCWWDPANRGCKTCLHFERERCCGNAAFYGCVGCPTGDTCNAGVDITGPIVNCEAWELNPRSVDA